MIGKVFIGKGNLQKFVQDYDLATKANKGRMWSTCYPTGKLVLPSDPNIPTPEFQMEFEYVIGYEAIETQPTQEKKWVV